MTEYAVQLKGVGKEYRHFTLADIDLDLPTGSIMGLIGTNGAGKSTTIRILMGLVRQDCGSVTVLERSMPQFEAAVRSRHGGTRSGPQPAWKAIGPARRLARRSLTRTRRSARRPHIRRALGEIAGPCLNSSDC